MITLIAILLFSILIYFNSKFIKKHAILIYSISTVLALLTFIFSLAFPGTVFSTLSFPWSKGFFGLALFYLVMLAGALPNWNYKKRIYSVRTELSIIGFISISPHAIFNLIKIFNNTIAPTYFGIITYVIMIPLFITSFIIIRKKMNNRHWKNLQRFAYLAYLLLFIHLVIQFSQPINRILYIVLFVVYSIFKIIKTVNILKSKPKN
ncbi:MAG: hypothetical protein PHT83_04575 [Bacilli bacterium]|nr:hypothetical protein [Bacilli bacterium]